MTRLRANLQIHAGKGEIAGRVDPVEIGIKFNAIKDRALVAIEQDIIEVQVAVTLTNMTLLIA